VGEDVRVLTFEDEDYRGEESDYWSSLVDGQQYGGKLLYGEGGTGVYDEAEAYRWYDEGNTFLSSMLNNSWGSWAYWNGGIAVSDYVDSNLDNVPYTDQLAVFRKGAEAGRGEGGHGASERFAVINGVDNTFVSSGTDTRAVLAFGDGQARTIDHAYVALTTYFLSNIVNGSSFCTAATEETFVDLLAEGFDAQGQKTGTATLRLVDGLHHVQGWTWFDLSALGKVCTVKFNFSVSDDQKGAYGVNTPTYVAIDDIAVRMDGTGTGIDNIPGASVGTDSERMYDLTGRLLRSARKGQIVIIDGRKVVY
jgi:hypothetical protein